MKWPTFPLSKLITIRKGRKPNLVSNEFSTDTPLPYITIEAFESGQPIQYASKEENTVISEKGDVLIVWDGARFGMVGTSIGGVLGSTLAKLIPMNSLDKDFLRYMLILKLPVLRSHQRGSGIPHLDSHVFNILNVPVPPPSEQRRIVEILDQAETLRKKRIEADVKAERILPALFYKIFGDPATNPNGLSLVPIRSLVSIVNRRNPSDQADTPFRYIDISGVDGTQGRITEVKNLIGVDAPSRARQVVKTNDVLISTVRPYLQATALVPSYLDNQICSTGFCVLRAKEGKGFGYLYALTRLPWFTERLNERARGASYPAVTDNDVLALCVPYPTDAKKIFAFDNLVSEVAKLQEQRLLSKGRSELLYSIFLHRAFSGDLTAKWREAHMKELLAEMEEQDRAMKPGTAPGNDEVVTALKNRREEF